MIFEQPYCEFTKYQQNSVGNGINQGIGFIPGTGDTKGAWTEIFSSVTDETYGIALRFHFNHIDSQARPTLADIGVDTAGGTSYSVLIPDLNAGQAASVQHDNYGGLPMPCKEGYWYYFPVYIKAGSSLAVRGQVGNATASSCRVTVKLFQNPTRPELLPVGSKVTTVGIDTGNSRGTLLTAGLSPNEGAWVSLGVSTISAFWIQMSYGIDSGAMGTGATGSTYFDVAYGPAGARRTLFENLVATHQAADDAMSNFMNWGPNCYVNFPSGTEIWARSKADSDSTLTNTNAMCWLVGY